MPTSWGSAAGLALVWAGIACAGAAAAPSSAVLGDLTFNYDPQSWRILPDGDGLVATCVLEDCRGAVVDVSRREGEAGCTEEAMVAEAMRLFPADGRAYANMLPAGRFALLLAQRHDGPELSSPEYAYGCVPWQGYEYRFAMRPDTVGDQSWIGGALHHLVSQATAAEARIDMVRIGDIEFPVSSDIWRIEASRREETVRLTCRMPVCRDQSAVAVLSIASSQQVCPGPARDAETVDGAETRITTLTGAAPDGPSFTVSQTFAGCRNYVPPLFEACAVHRDRSYHLSTTGSLECRSTLETIPEGVLIDLLEGARASR